MCGSVRARELAHAFNPRLDLSLSLASERAISKASPRSLVSVSRERRVVLRACSSGVGACVYWRSHGWVMGSKNPSARGGGERSRGLLCEKVSYSFEGWVVDGRLGFMMDF